MQTNMQYFSANREETVVLLKSRIENHSELNPASTTGHMITMKLLISLYLCASNYKMEVNNITYLIEFLVKIQQVNSCKTLRNSA